MPSSLVRISRITFLFDSAAGFLTQSPIGSVNSNEKKILWFCGVGHFYAHFYMLLFPSLALWIRDDFGLSLPETLNLGFLMYLLFGILAVPMGFLADRWGHRKLLVAMLVGMGGSSLVCAASPGPQTLRLGLAGIGFFAAIYHPVGIGLISKCCRNRGRALGNNGVWGNLGIGLAPVLGGTSCYLWGWRPGFGLFGGILVLVGGLMMAVRIDEEPVSHGEASSGQATAAGGNLVYFILMLACMALLGLCYRGTVVSVPGYFEQRIHALRGLFALKPGIDLTASHAFGTTLLVSGIYLFGIFGQMTGGRLADQMDLRKAYLMFHALSWPFMVLMGFLSEMPLFLAGMGYLFFSLGMQPIENSLVAHLTPVHLRSLAYGLKFILVLGMGSFAVKLVKWILLHQRPETVYFVQAGFIAVVVLLILLLWTLSRNRTFRNLPQSTEPLKAAAAVS